MVSIDWCIKQSKGIRKVKPSKNLYDSYLNMAERSISDLNKVETDIWRTTISYYIFYYSLYALMAKIGIKSEIHSCTILFLEKYLTKYYSENDIKMVKNSHEARINLQYYTKNKEENHQIRKMNKHSKIFYLKTKNTHLTREEIEKIRKQF